jgi:hypothetical protein
MQVNRDFPYALLPTNTVGHFCDFLPAPQVCKSFFQSFSSPPSVFFGASLPFDPFHTLFHPMRRHLLRGCRCFQARPFTFSYIRMPLRAISAAQSFPEWPGTTLAAPPPLPSESSGSISPAEMFPRRRKHRNNAAQLAEFRYISGGKQKIHGHAHSVSVSK